MWNEFVDMAGGADPVSAWGTNSVNIYLYGSEVYMSVVVTPRIAALRE